MTAREEGGKDSKMRKDSGMHLSNQRTVFDYSFVFLHRVDKDNVCDLFIIMC